MSAQNKIIIGKDIQIKAIDKITYTNVDVVFLESLPNDAKQPSSLIDGCVKVIDKYTEMSEIEDGAIDNVENVGKFCIGSDKIIKLIIEKGKITDTIAAKTKFNGTEIYYDFRDDLKFDEKNFDLKIFNGTGDKLYDSSPISLEQASNVISMYSKTVEVKEMGVLKYVLTNLTI